MWIEIGFSANHKSAFLGTEYKHCCDWLMPPELPRRSETLQDMESGTFSLTLSMCTCKKLYFSRTGPVIFIMYIKQKIMLQ
jgi:hypothetical protein